MGFGFFLSRRRFLPLLSRLPIPLDPDGEQLMQGRRVPVMFDCLLVSSASFRGAHGSDYWRLARIGTSDPESSQRDPLGFLGVGFWDRNSLPIS